MHILSVLIFQKCNKSRKCMKFRISELSQGEKNMNKILTIFMMLLSKSILKLRKMCRIF